MASFIFQRTIDEISLEDKDKFTTACRQAKTHKGLGLAMVHDQHVWPPTV